MLIAGRVIQGFGGGVFPLAFGIIRDEFPRDRVAGGIGLMSSLLGIGGGARRRARGPDRRAPVLPLAVLVPLDRDRDRDDRDAALRPESPVKTPGTINWPAGILMSVGLTAVLVAVSQTHDVGLDVAQDDRADRDRRVVLALLGPRRAALRACRSSTCA